MDCFGASKRSIPDRALHFPVTFRPLFNFFVGACWRSSLVQTFYAYVCHAEGEVRHQAMCIGEWVADTHRLMT